MAAEAMLNLAKVRDPGFQSTPEMQAAVVKLVHAVVGVMAREPR
jgi:hypothetical protein